MTRKNLMADVFGAIMLRLRGTEDYIERLAKIRSMETLTRVRYHNPEYYPYPIAHEACTLIYNDLEESLST